MRVLFITNIPSPYRVDFFNELGKYCTLCVLFEKAFSDERDDNWRNYRFENFEGIILKGISTDVDKAFCPDVIKYLRRYKKDIIVVANTITPTGILEIAYMKAFRIGYFLEADGAIYRGDNPIKKRIKCFLMSKANGYFSSAYSLDYYFNKYGATQERIFRYPFSSIRNNQILNINLSDEEKKNFKDRLAIAEDRIVLYVGQFIHRKGIDVLLRSWGMCNLNNCGLYLIGGSLSNECKDIVKSEELKNVHIVNFLRPEQLSEYYQAADVFVLPTREDIWGLVVNEALSYGLPVITTDQCVAGLEMIEDGVNGYLIENEDTQRLSERITFLIENGVVRKRISEHALATARKYTIETMVEAHTKVFHNMEQEKEQDT